MNVTSLELRSEITSTGQLRLSLEERDVAAPGPEEVALRVEAAPINPADDAERATIRQALSRDRRHLDRAEGAPRRLSLARKRAFRAR
jgi:NADPH2:quinone reductase